MRSKIVILACLALASCITPAKFQEWAKAHPDQSARICSDLYPVKTEYREGTTITRTDTAYVTGDSIPCPPAETGKVVYVKVPDTRTITVYQDRVDTVVHENTAHVRALQGDSAHLVVQNGVLQAERDKAKETSRKAIYWAIGLACSLGLGVVLIIKGVL